MKRFVIPAIIVVDIPDDRNVEYAEEIASEVKNLANSRDIHFTKGHYVLLDEGLPSVQIPFNEDDELPHSYLPVMSKALFATPTVKLPETSSLPMVPTYVRSECS